MIELNENDILQTINFIVLNNKSFNEIKEDYTEISEQLNLYSEAKERYDLEIEIFDFFLNILKKDPRALNKYIDIEKFKIYLNNIDQKKLEDIIETIERNIQNTLIDVINILLKNKNILKKIKSKHSKIKSELTILNNEAKNKIYKYFSDISSKNKKCLTEFIVEYPNFIKEFNINEIIKRDNNYSEKVFYIFNDEKSWSSFASQAKSKNFKYFSIIEKNNILEVYFL